MGRSCNPGSRWRSHRTSCRRYAPESAKSLSAFPRRFLIFQPRFPNLPTYCRVPENSPGEKTDMCRRSWKRPGQRNSDPIINGSSIQRTSEFRVPSVISNRTGFCVLLWVIDVRSFTCPATKTSATFSLTRSHPRSLLSMRPTPTAGRSGGCVKSRNYQASCTARCRSLRD